MDNSDENETEITQLRVPRKFSEKKHPLITDLDHRDNKQKKIHKADLWFERDAFKNLIDEVDEDIDLDRMVDEYKKKGIEIPTETTNSKDNKVISKPKKLNDEVDDSDTTNSDLTDSEDDDDSGSDYDVEKEVWKNQKDEVKKQNGLEIVKKDR